MVNRAKIAAVVLLILVVSLVLYVLRPAGRAKLPVGSTKPAIALGLGSGVILASDGSLWSWGAEELGWPVLGLGSCRSTTTLQRIGKGTDWVSIAAGPYHNLAVKTDGTLWSWGGNFRSQLGDGTRTSRNVPGPSVAGNDWKQGAVGIHSVVLKKDGTLWSWGNNWAGNLGIGTTNDITSPQQIGSGTNWVQVWTQGIQNLGLQSDGSLWFWGLDMSVKPERKILVPTRVSSGSNWTEACFGSFMMFGLKSDGTLWAWGWKAHIYTGTTNRELNSVPTRVGSDTDWRSCASAGARYQAFLKKDGSLWVLESSDPDFVSAADYKAPAFKRLALQKDFVAIAAGNGPVGVALTRDGEVWTWGRVLGARTLAESAMQIISPLLYRIGLKTSPGRPQPVMRSEPWELTGGS